MNGILKTALIVTFLFSLQSNPEFLAAQQKSDSKTASHGAQNEKLAKPAILGNLTLRLFKDLHDDMVFTLVTSWIPGEDHKGRFRYKVTPTPKLNDEYQSALAQYGIMSKRVQACYVAIVLMDADGFELRRVEPTLGPLVNSEADTTGLFANESVQMDASEYKSFIGNGDKSGSWNIAWSCAGK